MRRQLVSFVRFCAVGFSVLAFSSILVLFVPIIEHIHGIWWTVLSAGIWGGITVIGFLSFFGAIAGGRPHYKTRLRAKEPR